MKTLLFLLLLPVAAFSQFYVGISIGASFPTGDFADNDINGEASQFAKPGFYIDLQPNYYFTENIGLALIGSYAINQVDEDDISRKASQEIGGNWLYSSSEFKQLSFLAGPQFRINAQQLTFSLAPLIGITSVDNISQRLYSFQFPGIASNVSISGDEGLTYGGQVALAFPLSDKLSLGLHLRYLINNVERSVIIVTTDGQGGLDRDDLLDDTAFSFFQSGLSLSYSF
jgi:hypothetical protein